MANVDNTAASVAAARDLISGFSTTAAVLATTELVVKVVGIDGDLPAQG